MARIEIDDERMDATKVLRLYSKLAATRLATLCVRYSYNDLRRQFAVADDERHDVVAHSDDPLGAMLLAGLRALPDNDRGAADAPIELHASLAVLVEPDLRAFRPFALVAFDVAAATTVVGCLTACGWVDDTSFATEQYTPAALRRAKVPIDESYLLVDVVSSAKRGVGALLVLEAYLTAARTRRTGLAAVAVTAGGRALFDALGFRRHGRELYHVAIGELRLADVHRRLQLDDALVTDVCWRRGLTRASAANVIGRC